MQPPTVTVEFFGIPRARAGVAQTTAYGETLGEVLTSLASSLPEFGAACIHDGRLKPGYTINLDGQRFTTKPQTPLTPGQTLLVMSLDAGG